MSIRQDIPILRAEEDTLGRASLVQRICETLIAGKGDRTRATRMVVGLSGHWGSGKSSILGQVSDALRRKANVFVVEFNPWIFKDSDDLISDFFREMSAQLYLDSFVSPRGFRRALRKYNSAISDVLGLFGKRGEAIKAIFRFSREQTVLQRRMDLEEILAKIPAAVVVLIDELDRVDANDVKLLARLIKAVADLPNISYLIAYDREKVEQALGGPEYLEKVIQVTFPLRPLMDYETSKILQDSLLEYGYLPNLGHDEAFRELEPVLSAIFRTPRDVKRAASNFHALEMLVRNELNPVDVLAYSVLASKFPSVREAVAQDVDLVVADPISTPEVVSRIMSEHGRSLQERLGLEAKAPSVGLLNFLFNSNDPGRADTFGRLELRHNLLAMLFLENPPFRVSRKAVEAFWSAPTAAAVRAFVDAGKASDFVGQLGALFETLNSNNDVAAYYAILEGAQDGKPYLDAIGRSLLRGWEEICLKYVGRTGDSEQRVRKLFNHLSDTDFVFAPSLMRAHLFKWGLTGQSPRGDPAIFSKTETEKLALVQSERCEEFIKSGQWIDFATDGDILYLPLGLNREAHFRSELEFQLRDPKAVTNFARLLVPPGYTISKDLIQRFVDPAVLRKTLSKMAELADEWSRKSVDRLRTAVGLKGDPNFIMAD